MHGIASRGKERRLRKILPKTRYYFTRVLIAAQPRAQPPCSAALRKRLSATVKLDFDRKSSDHKDTTASLFASVLLKRYRLDLPAI